MISQFSQIICYPSNLWTTELRIHPAAYRGREILLECVKKKIIAVLRKSLYGAFFFLFSSLKIILSIEHNFTEEMEGK